MGLWSLKYINQMVSLDGQASITPQKQHCNHRAVFLLTTVEFSSLHQHYLQNLRLLLQVTQALAVVKFYYPN